MSEKLDELLRSQAKRHTERAIDIERLRNHDGGISAEMDSAFKAEAEREVQKAAALERLRRFEP